MVFYKAGGQKGRATVVDKMKGKKVQCSLTNDSLVRGVVTGIPVNVHQMNLKQTL